MVSRTASCSCGQLRIEVEGEPLGVGVCHCLACQRRTGSVFATLASFAAPYRVSGRATEHVRVGDQGARFTFRFCPVCGTTLFHTEEGREQSSVSVAVGAFAARASPRRKSPSTTAAGIPGSSFRASGPTTRTRTDRAPSAADDDLDPENTRRSGPEIHTGGRKEV